MQNQRIDRTLFSETNRLKFTLINIAILLMFLVLMGAKDSLGALLPPSYYCSFDTVNLTGYNVACTGGYILQGINTPTMNKTSKVFQGAGLNGSQLEYFALSPTEFEFNSSSWSMSIIFNYSTVSGNPVLWAKTDGVTAANSAYLLILISATGKMEFSSYYKTVSSGTLDSVSLFNNTNVTQYLALTYDISTKNLSMYKNGVFDANGTFTGMNTLPLLFNVLGKYGNHPSGYMTANYIDEFKFWNNTVLSQADVLADYNRILAGLRPDNDTTKPSINLTYPVNNTRMNDYNGTISFFTNESSFCGVNNSAWTNTSTNLTAFQFDSGVIADGKYTILISCNDTSYNLANLTIYFEIDAGKPQITKYLPSNNSITNQTTHNFIVDAYDSFALWQMNITIRNSTGNNMYSALVGNISISGDTQFYNYSAIVNTAGWTATQDNFSYFIEVWDAHTGEDIEAVIFPKDEYTINEDRETIIINEKMIEIVHPDTEIFDFQVQNDRVNFEITEQTKDNSEKRDTYFTVYGENIVSLPFSTYANHHIINNNIWFDTEGMENANIEIISDDIIKVNYMIDSEPLKVESFGILNYMNQTSYFYIDKVPPTITINYPTAPQYNKSEFLNYLEISVSENSSCTQNDTNFIYLYSNSTTWHFISTFVGVGNHTVLFSCTDNYGNKAQIEQTFEILETVGTGGAIVTVTTTVNIDIPLIIVIALYIFFILFAFKSGEWLILMFASVYGLFMGLWLWNTYPVFPKPILLVLLVFNAFLIIMAIGNRK